MNPNEFIIWGFERTLLRSVRYVLRGREGWTKTGSGAWLIIDPPTTVPQEGESVETPVVEAGAVVDADKPLARAVREARAATHVRNVIVSLPLSRLLVQVMKFPAEMRNDLADAVSLQMDKLSPFGGEELTISHEVLAETDTEIWVVGAAMPAITFNDIGSALQLAKLHVTRTDISGLGWFRTLCAPLQLTRPGRRVVLMDLDDGWDLMIIDHGIPVLIRGMGVQQDIASLIREITLSFMSAELEAGACLTSEVLLISNNPPDPERDSRIQKLLDAPVHHHKPPHEDGGVEGVALRTRENASMDLTPLVWRTAIREAKITKRVYTGVAIAMACWAIIIGCLVGSPRYYKFRADRCKAYAKAHEKAYKQVADTRARVQLIESYMDRTRSSLEMLRIVSEALPQGVTLAGFTYKKETGIKINGDADVPSLVYTYKDAITANPLFETVTLTGPAASRGKHKFDIDAKFKGSKQDK